MTWAQFRDLLPVLTFALGAGLTVLTEWARNRWTETARQRAAREEFIRSGVVQLQEKLDVVADAAQDHRGERRSSSDGKIEPEVFERFHRTSLASYSLLAHLPSEALRDAADELLAVAYEVATTEPHGDEDGYRSKGTDDEGRVADMLARLNALTEQFGVILRELHGITE